VGTVADALSRLDVDSLKIQEEEVLTLLSKSENNSISNIKLTSPMQRKGLSPTSLLNTTY
jgi:hypothetical protein